MLTELGLPWVPESYVVCRMVHDTEVTVLEVWSTM